MWYWADLAARSREVQREGGHVSAQIVDVKDEVLRQSVGFLQPDGWIDQTVRSGPRRCTRSFGRQPFLVS